MSKFWKKIFTSKYTGKQIDEAVGKVLDGDVGMTNPMTAAGDIIIGGTDGEPEKLSKGTDGKVLKMVSGAPGWADDAGGITQEEADERYLQLSGGTITGNVAFTNTKGIAVNNIQVFDVGNGSNQQPTLGNVNISGNLSLRTNDNGVILHKTSLQNFTVLDTGNTSANPTLSGGETSLSSLKLNGVKYAVGVGPTHLYWQTVICSTSNTVTSSFIFIILTTSSTLITVNELKTMINGGAVIALTTGTGIDSNQNQVIPAYLRADTIAPDSFLGCWYYVGSTGDLNRISWSSVSINSTYSSVDQIF